MFEQIFSDKSKERKAPAKRDKPIADTFTSWSCRGYLHLEDRNFTEAIWHFDQELKINKDSVWAWQIRAQALIKLGRNKEALADLNRAIDLSSGCSLYLLQLRGEVFLRLGFFKDAIRDLDSAIKMYKDPERLCAHAYKYKGVALLLLGDYEGAIENLDKAISMVPELAFAWRARGAAKYELERFEETIEDCSKAIELKPNSNFAFMYRGAAKRMLNRHEAAILDFDKSIKLNPICGWAWERRGDSKFALKHYGEAIKDLKVALRLDNCSDFAKQVLSAVEKQLEEEKKQLESAKKASTPAVASGYVRPPVYQQQSSSSLPSPSAPALSSGVVLHSVPFVAVLPNEVARPIPSAPMWSGAPAVPTAPVLSGNSNGKNPIQDLNNAKFDAMAIPSEELMFREVLREGGFGIVHKGEWWRTSLHKIDVAIKKLKLGAISQKTMGDFKKEVEVQSKLKSPATVELYAISYVGEFYCLVMELMDRDSLRDFLDQTEPEKIGWDIRLQIAKDVATGLDYLHSQNPVIIHGDIKSLNILLNSRGQAKLADFGFSTLGAELSSRSTVQKSGEQANRQQGTLLWKAPEQFKMNAKLTPECDMHGFGIVLWEVASGLLPYSCARGDQGLIRTYKETGQKEDFDERTPNTPDEYKFVSEQCWSLKPSERLTAKVALEILEDIRLYGKNTTVRVMFQPVRNVQPQNSSNGQECARGFGKQ